MTQFQDIAFPPGFLWGCATASHQVEGNCTKNHWWAWEQEGGHIRDGSVSGLACDHYNRFEEDFALARELGHNAHRISIEWSRIEPEEGRWDSAEVDHYRRVLESMHRNGLTPLVTLHHFTNPLWFQQRGGWLLPESLDLIARYAAFMARELGDLVPIWLTINEPMVVAAESYLMGLHPPCEQDLTKAMTVARHMLLAHGRMYQAIREATTHNPRIGPVKQMPHFEPLDPASEEDRQAAQSIDNLFNEFFLAGVDQGVVPPPVGQGEEVPGLKGTWDIIGLNHYTRTLVSAEGQEPPGTFASPPEGAEVTAMGDEVYPEGIYHQLIRLAKYQKPIYVTENGISTLDDEQRCRYLLRYLREVQRAISDGADVRGYLQWTFVDNFEWAEGFAQKFGIVAMEPGTLRRIPKPSAYMYREIAAHNGIPARLFQEHLG